MPRKQSKVMSAADKKAVVTSARAEVKDAKDVLKSKRAIVSSAKKELSSATKEFKAQERLVAKAVKAVKKITGK